MARGPILRRILDEAYYVAPDGATRIVTLTRNNLHRGLERILQRASLEPWDDLMQTLRRSRETEWAMKYPAYAVAQWMGHSVAVSAKHYVQVVDALYDQAAGEGVAAESAAAERLNGMKSIATGETTVEGECPENAENPAFPAKNAVRLEGLEPSAYGLKVRCSTN